MSEDFTNVFRDGTTGKLYSTDPHETYDDARDEAIEMVVWRNGVIYYETLWNNGDESKTLDFTTAIEAAEQMKFARVDDNYEARQAYNSLIYS